MRIRNKKHYEPKKSRIRNWKVIAIALYITLILLSTIPYIADRTIESNMKESYEYHLRYPKDGRQTHYYVERINSSQIGTIDLVYFTASNSLTVDVDNIKVLHIYCRSMYEDECKKVFGINPMDNSNYYKWYFIEKNHLNVNIDSVYQIQDLSFIDTPIPYKVIVNGVRWTEGVNYFYTEDFSTALSNVPSGHTTVDIYFKPDDNDGIAPNAILATSKTLVQVNHTILFDASQSFDIDGEIIRYIMDFGDGTIQGGDKQTYYYSEPGIYGVILTVCDNDYLVDHAIVNITIVSTSNLPEIQGIVPNQVKPEDSPPWSLNLSAFEPIASSKDIEFYWYLTGENTSLYSVVGENSSNDRLIFTPVPDSFGSNLVTLRLHSSEDVSVSQPLWINITPINDPPVLNSLPDLIVHYDDPYTFNYEPYVFDKETPINGLTLEIYDGYLDDYITISGITATYTYPQKLVGENIYATITVSDGEAVAQDVISVQVTSDYVPELVKELPDLWMLEGTTKYNVFDLDDYFTDPDNDAIYFSYGQSHLTIVINMDHTVDLTADSEWTGSELVTFRARDPIGAIAEDSIIVTVLPVNDPPTIQNVPDFYIRYNNDYRFDLTPYVHDNDNTTFELKIIVSDPEHIRLDIRNNMVIIMNYPAEYLGQSIPVRLTVFDGLDSAFQDVTVTITEDFPPELLTPIPDIIFLEDLPHTNAFDLDHYFMDVDGDVLYYTTGNKYIIISINPDNTVDLSAPADWFGDELVYFRATDPTGALQEDLVSVTVLPVNDPPVLKEIPPQYGNESERWILDLEPYIFDVDNNISELELNTDSEYVVVSGSSLVFLGSKELPKQLEVTLSDGELETSQMIEIHLRLNKKPRVPTMFDLFMNILPILIIVILVILIIASLVYYKKSRFTAEEIFLIHTGGTLITHLSRRPQANVDDIIFSGMFTAVQEFIKDTFSSGEDEAEGSLDAWALDELKLGENNILIERSENAYLAVIFSGEGSNRLRKIVTRLLDKIETKYGNVLLDWDGNINELEGTKKILSVLIKPLEKEDKKEASSIEEGTTDKDYVVVRPTPTPTKSFAQFSGDGLQVEPFYRTQPQFAMAQTNKEPVTSRALTLARPVMLPKKACVKELLECAGKSTGAPRPGLTPWQLAEARVKGMAWEMDKLPVALHIHPKRRLPKTIAIVKDRMQIKHQPAPMAKRVSDISKDGKLAKPINIDMPGRTKKLKLDPSRSILHQLAKINDDDDEK